VNAKLFRAAGVAAALFVPVGGISVLATGVAGAAGPALTASINTSPSQTVSCPTYTGTGDYNGCTASGGLGASVHAALTSGAIAATSTIHVNTVTCLVTIRTTIPLTGNTGSLVLVATGTTKNFTASASCGTLDGRTVTITVNTP